MTEEVNNTKYSKALLPCCHAFGGHSNTPSIGQRLQTSQASFCLHRTSWLQFKYDSPTRCNLELGSHDVDYQRKQELRIEKDWVGIDREAGWPSGRCPSIQGNQ